MTNEELEAERARQQRISELRNELSAVDRDISHFEHVLKVLTDSRLKMTGLKNRLKNEASDPIINYDIDGVNDWKGINANNGKAAYDEVNTQRTAYDFEISVLDSDIENGVDNANKRIQDLYRRRSSILSELNSL